MRATFPIGLISVGTMSDAHLTIHPSSNINSRDLEMYTPTEAAGLMKKKIYTLLFFEKSKCSTYRWPHYARLD